MSGKVTLLGLLALPLPRAQHTQSLPAQAQQCPHPFGRGYLPPTALGIMVLPAFTQTWAWSADRTGTRLQDVKGETSAQPVSHQRSVGSLLDTGSFQGRPPEYFLRGPAPALQMQLWVPSGRPLSAHGLPSKQKGSLPAQRVSTAKATGQGHWLLSPTSCHGDGHGKDHQPARKWTVQADVAAHSGTRTPFPSQSGCQALLTSD